MKAHAFDTVLATLHDRLGKESDDAIGREVGCPRHVVRKYRVRVGIASTLTSRWLKHDVGRIRAMVAAGCPNAEIGKALGISPSRVSHYRVQHGIHAAENPLTRVEALEALRATIRDHGGTLIDDYRADGRRTMTYRVGHGAVMIVVFAIGRGRGQKWDGSGGWSTWLPLTDNGTTSAEYAALVAYLESSRVR